MHWTLLVLATHAVPPPRGTWDETARAWLHEADDYLDWPSAFQRATAVPMAEVCGASIESTACLDAEGRASGVVRSETRSPMHTFLRYEAGVLVEMWETGLDGSVRAYQSHAVEAEGQVRYEDLGDRILLTRTQEGVGVAAMRLAVDGATVDALLWEAVEGSEAFDERAVRFDGGSGRVAAFRVEPLAQSPWWERSGWQVAWVGDRELDRVVLDADRAVGAFHDPGRGMSFGYDPTCPGKYCTAWKVVFKADGAAVGRRSRRPQVDIGVSCDEVHLCTSFEPVGRCPSNALFLRASEFLVD